MSASEQPIVHTPPPWNLLCSDARGRPRCLVVCSKDNEIASINPFRETWNEDAELIAAAPDLLAACLAFLEADNQCGANLAFVMAQEAVKKAGIAPKENGGETCDMKHGPCSCGATH